MPREPSPEEEVLAAKLVDTALAGFEALLPPCDVEILRAVMESELVATTEGQRMLRTCMPDPQVAASDEVLKPHAGVPAPARKGTGRP